MSNKFLRSLREEGIPVKNNGMCNCPKCGGDGFVDDWDSPVEISTCTLCKGKGEIAPKFYRTVMSYQIKGL